MYGGIGGGGGGGFGEAGGGGDDGVLPRSGMFFYSGVRLASIAPTRPEYEPGSAIEV